MIQSSKFIKIIEKLKTNSMYRELPRHKTNCIDFSSNDYLGLSKNPEVVEAGIKASKVWGWSDWFAFAFWKCRIV